MTSDAQGPGHGRRRIHRQRRRAGISSASGYDVVNVDKLTYSGNLDSAARGRRIAALSFHQADICDRPADAGILADEQPDAIMHLAAESHVDRSIDGPAAFIETNVVGTFRLLDAALDYWRGLDDERRARLPLPSRLDRRGVRRPAARRRHLHRRDALCAVVALFGVEGRSRPSRAGLARDLRPAGRAVELLEQLRAVSIFPKS